MRQRMDDDLNLEQLLTRCKVLDPGIMVRIYFNPYACWFYISYTEELEFFLSPDASLICHTRADQVRVCIEVFIARAVRKFIEPVE